MLKAWCGSCILDLAWALSSLGARTSSGRRSGSLFNFWAGTLPELLISPRSLVADAVEFNSSNDSPSEEDFLLELLRTGQTMDREQFIAQLRQQRSSATASSESEPIPFWLRAAPLRRSPLGLMLPSTS